MRGLQGFVEFTSFTLKSPIKQMTHYGIVTHSSELSCPENYLVLVMANQVIFFKAVTIGDCKIEENQDC